MPPTAFPREKRGNLQGFFCQVLHTCSFSCPFSKERIHGSLAMSAVPTVGLQFLPHVHGPSPHAPVQDPDVPVFLFSPFPFSPFFLPPLSTRARLQPRPEERIVSRRRQVHVRPQQARAARPQDADGAVRGLLDGFLSLLSFPSLPPPSEAREKHACRRERARTGRSADLHIH